MGDSAARDGAGPPDVTALGAVDPITVLHVDRDADFVEMAARLLERERPSLEIRTETRVDAALDRLTAPEIDCVVSGFRFPGTTGLEFVDAVRSRRDQVPIILFSVKDADDVGRDAIAAGATDVVRKRGGRAQYCLLANRIVNAVSHLGAQRLGQQLLGAIEAAREGISLLDDDGRFVYVNQAYADRLGYERGALLGEHWEILYPGDEIDRVEAELIQRIPADSVLREETEMLRADGSAVVTDHVLGYTAAGIMVCNIDVQPATPEAG